MKKYLTELAEQLGIKIAFFKTNGRLLCFLKDHKDRALNDGYSLDEFEAIELLQARCKNIQGDTQEERNG